MAQLQTSFDPTAVEPGQSGLDPIPAGEYVAQIIESDVVTPKSGQGLMLNITYEVIEGEYQNRKVWDRINYQHTSAQAQLIGQQRLKAICDALGLSGHLEDSEQLHFQPLRIRVGIDDKDKNYAPKNEVKAVKPISAEAPAGKPAAAPAPRHAAPAQRPAAGAAPAAGATRPWKTAAAR